jgi:hypothetical protein
MYATTNHLHYKTRAAIEEFMAVEDTLLDCLMLDHYNEREGKLCSCGNGYSTVKCNECYQYQTSCPRCFADSHYHHPFHWAWIWNAQQRLFQRTDYSKVYSELGTTTDESSGGTIHDNTGEQATGSAAAEAGIPGGFKDVIGEETSNSTEIAIQLGHIGERVPCPFNDTSIAFTITHCNGMHSSRIRVCRCPGAPSKAVQLMQARLFPASISDPRSAFTFAVLTEFHMHNMQSKCAAYDYILSLRRLTNFMFPQTVPVRLYIGCHILITLSHLICIGYLQIISPGHANLGIPSIESFCWPSSWNRCIPSPPPSRKYHYLLLSVS